MEKKEIVSIIVPIYNTESRLNKCLDSILSQTYSSFELILINDGSTDNCDSICKEYAKVDKRVRYYSRENKGVSAARNYGLSVAKGKYIMFCDSDDEVEEQWCEELVRGIEQYPDCMVSCGVYRKKADDSVRCFTCDETNKYIKLGKEQYYSFHKLGSSGSLCNKIFNLEKIQQNGLSLDTDLVFAEDIKFCSEYASLCEGYFFVQKPLYCYLDFDKYFVNFYDVLKLSYEFRKNLISLEDKQRFCYEYYYKFVHCLNDTFDHRNKESFFKKIKRNNDILNDSTFVEVISSMAWLESERRLIARLKKGKYFPIYLSAKKNKMLRVFRKNK